MLSADVNLLAVLVSAIITMIVGAIWYSPALFARPWMSAVGKTEEEIREGGQAGYAIAAFSAIVMAYVLAHFISFANAKTILEGLQIGFWAWLGFVASTSIVNTSFSGRPLKLYFLEAGYFLVALVLNGAILALWR